MELLLHPVDLQLKDTFETAHSKRDVQRSFIVELREQGLSGYGEAPMNTYYDISLASIQQELEKARGIIANYTWGSPEAFHDLLTSSGIHLNFALGALDEAAYDLYGKMTGQPTYAYLKSDITHIPLSDYTIGIDTIDKMVDKMQAQPWPIYKIKLGTPEDLDIIKALRSHTDAVFRVDANCGWTAAETIRNAKELIGLGVEFIEQPLVPEDWSGMKKVFEASVLPVIADESCQVEADVAKCRGYFHGINIKLTKCGGITPARRMIKEARGYDMQVMAGCMNESSVGISAVAQLLPQLDYADMDGILLITNDPAEGVTIIDGQIHFPARNGNGVVLTR